MKKISPDGSTMIEETAPGHYDITCTTSGRPYMRSGDLGMFCDASPCACEIASRNIANTMPPALRKAMGL